jgi:FixJ family two-component response regulator
MAEPVSSRPDPNSEARSTVLVIDDDADLRNSVGRLLRSVGLNAQLFASIPDFLKSERPNTPACLVLDIRLPGKAVSTFSASSPVQTSISQSSSLLGTAISP